MFWREKCNNSHHVLVTNMSKIFNGSSTSNALRHKDGVAAKTTFFTYRLQCTSVSTTNATRLLHPSHMIQRKYSPRRTLNRCRSNPAPIPFHQRELVFTINHKAWVSLL